MPKHLIAIMLFLVPVLGYASHFRGGQIRVISSNGLKCVIELRLVTNTASDIRAGEGIFDFGDGTTYTTPTKDNIKLTEQPDLGLVIYTLDHEYPAPGFYLVSYTEPNLAAGILNMTNSVETRFNLESGINVTPDRSFAFGDFPTNPICIAPLYREYSFSTAVLNDSTSNEFFYKYTLVTNPKLVTDFEVPGNLEVNRDNGMITWDTKFHDQYTAGLFWIQVKVEKYSKAGDYCGYVIRALQIMLEDTGSRIGATSSLTDPSNKVVATDGNESRVKFVMSDSKNAVNAFSLNLYYNERISKNVSVTSYDSTSGDEKFKIAVVSMKTSPHIVTDIPYPITLRGRSDYYYVDLTLLYMTKDMELPKTPVAPPPPIVTGLKNDNSLNVYPNPFRSELYIDGSTSVEATLVDTFGHTVMRSQVTDGQPLNTTSLPAGFYILQLTDENGLRSAFKVVRH